MKTPSRQRVMVVIGTRPEAIKLAPVVRELARRRFDVRICGTGQHKGLLDQTLRELGLRPRRHLAVMRPNQTLSSLSARLLEAMAEVLSEWRPGLVVVQGDTTSTFIGALAAFYQRIPVAHVEAGLRTGERYSPFPEELSRAMVARLATLHFAPTPAARANLVREGISRRDIHLTGNTGVDSLRWAARQGVPRARGALDPSAWEAPRPGDGAPPRELRRAPEGDLRRAGHAGRRSAPRGRLSRPPEPERVGTRARRAGRTPAGTAAGARFPTSSSCSS